MAQPPKEITISIAEVVSDALGRPIAELPPLSEAVDLDAVDALVTDDPSQDATVVFTYAGLRVTVCSREMVYARPADDDRSGRLSTTSR